jgi:hypothetical protein
MVEEHVAPPEAKEAMTMTTTTQPHIPTLDEEVAALRRELDAEFESPTDQKPERTIRFARIRAMSLELCAGLFSLGVVVFALLPNDTKAMWMYWAGMAWAFGITIWLLKRIFRP